MDQSRSRTPPSPPSPLLPLSNSSNSSSLKKMGCREVKMRRKDKIKRKRNSQAKDPKTFEANSQGRSPSAPPPRNQNGKKREKCIPLEECTKKEKKKGGGESQQERWRDKEVRKKEG